MFYVNSMKKIVCPMCDMSDKLSVLVDFELKQIIRLHCRNCDTILTFINTEDRYISSK